MQESHAVTETEIIKEENTESDSSKDTTEHKHVLARDVPQIDCLATDVNTSTVYKFESNEEEEEEVGQETRKDIDLKEESETFISSDEVKMDR